MRRLTLVHKLDPERSSHVRAVDQLEAVARRALAGDERQMAELLLAVLPAVRSACKALLGPAHPDLDDATQNALIALNRALPHYRFECSVLHCAVRITFRTTHGYRRRLRLFAERFRPMPDERELAEVPTLMSTDAALLNEQTEALRRLMAKLPQQQAEALLLHIGLEYSLAEVASICEVPLNTVKTRLRLGKEALRRRIARDPTLRGTFGGHRD